MRASAFGVFWVAAAMLVACGGGNGRSGVEPDEEEVPLETGVRIDGSSTVFPIVHAARERFQGEEMYPVSIQVSGTSGGFRRFCGGETTISAASRPIRQEEQVQCLRNDVEFVELPVAYDGIVVAVHPSNYWANAMSVEQLRRLWEPGARDTIRRWNQIDDSWPDEPIHLYAPGRDSGTYDYFAEAITGGDELRADYTASEDDNFLVRRVRRDPHGLAFFGYAYYAGNRGRLKVVAISDGNELNGEGAVAPSVETVAAGEYQPLSRPLFIYANGDAVRRVQVRRFITTILDHPREVVASAGSITLSADAYELGQSRFEANRVGSSFAGAELEEGLTVELLLRTDE